MACRHTYINIRKLLNKNYSEDKVFNNLIEIFIRHVFCNSSDDFLIVPNYALRMCGKLTVVINGDLDKYKGHTHF